MTLNITVLTPDVIYQSSDFRLSNSVSGETVRDDSNKSVSLQYGDWLGFVTYTGLGSWDGKDTSAWTAEWLTGLESPTFESVAEQIAEKATASLNRVRRPDRSRFKHTFTLAAFVDGAVRVAVISNFETAFGGSRGTPNPTMAISYRELRASERSLVIVTGVKAAVSPAHRAALKRLATGHPDDAGQIRRLLHSVNAEGSRTPSAGGLVSEDCVVVSIRSDGSSTLQPSGSGAPSPSGISHGINTRALMEEALANLGVDTSSMRLVQSVSGRFGPDRPQIASRPCVPRIVEPESGSEYRLVEIRSSEFVVASPMSVNSHGQIVGTGQAAHNQPQSISWLWNGSAVSALPFEGSAMALNDRGDIAANLMTADRTTRAAIWKDGSLVDLGIYSNESAGFQGTDSSSFGIDATGVVVGSVRSSIEERGMPNTRPAVFSIGDPIQTLMDIPAPFGSHAAAMNRQGKVLVQASPAIFDSRAIIWDLETGEWSYIARQQANIYPIAFTDGGRVLGQARDQEAQPVAVISESNESWEPLGTGNGWTPCGMNQQGDVVGWVRIDGLQRPWLHRADGGTEMLPYFADHNTTPQKINDHGVIIGSAGSDHGHHAVRWKPGDR